MNSVVEVRCWSDREDTGVWVDARLQREWQVPRMW